MQPLFHRYYYYTQLISYQTRRKICQRHELIQIETLLSCFSYFKRLELLIDESYLSIFMMLM